MPGGLRAGTLRHVVTLQNPITTVTDGEPVDAWVPVADVRASVRILSSDERLAAAQLQEQVSHSVRLRYRSDIDHNSRLIWRDRRLDVVVADADEVQLGMDLRCLEHID